MIVVLLPDGGRGYLSKIFNDDWMADYGFLTTETAEPKIADVLARKRRRLPAFVHAHPEETVPAAIAILREYNVSQLPVMKEEPPVMAAEVVGSVVERDLLDALVSGRAAPDDPVGGAHVRRRCPWWARASRSAAPSRRWKRPTRRVVLVDGRPAGHDHPAGRARLPRGPGVQWLERTADGFETLAIHAGAGTGPGHRRRGPADLPGLHLRPGRGRRPARRATSTPRTANPTRAGAGGVPRRRWKAASGRFAFASGMAAEDCLLRTRLPARGPRADPARRVRRHLPALRQGR